MQSEDGAKLARGPPWRRAAGTGKAGNREGMVRGPSEAARRRGLGVCHSELPVRPHMKHREFGLHLGASQAAGHGIDSGP